jgi:hypothetical protein
MDLTFDVNEVLRKRLAESLGLDSYAQVMDNVHQTNIALDMDFQKTFNAFFIVRRNASWRKIYYDLFENMKGQNPSFEYILRYMYEKTGNIEASFSSKMLATLCPDKPIWDRYVVDNLGLKLEGKSKEEQLNNAIRLYAAIEKWYEVFLATEKAKECLKTFDEALPDYRWINPIKKIDCFLWSIR